MGELSPFDMVVLIVFAAGITRILTGPLGAAIGDRIRGHREPVPDVRLEGEMDALRGRLAEVEERLDFAERLLASRDHQDQLPGGAHR
jgi:hypothetical protein